MAGSDKRRLWREFHAEHNEVAEEWGRRDCMYPPPAFPVVPEELRGMTCGAKTQAGTPCKLTTLYDSGRCKWHGGLSTGPKTEAGKEQSRINGRNGGRPRKVKPES